MADTELFPPAQVVALIECMLATARVDGLQPQEVDLLRGFHATQQQPGLPAFEQILNAPGPEQAPIDAVRAAPGFADEVVRMCLVTGYADGKLSAAERQHVHTIASALGVSSERFAELHVQVQDALLGSLSHLPDAESVAALAKEL